MVGEIKKQKYLVSNCSWANGELSADFKQLFDLLAKTAALATHAQTAGSADSGRFEKWLRGQDSNLRPGG